MKVGSTTELAQKVAQDPNLQEQIKADPVTTIANLATPLHTDVRIYRIVVVVLGVIALIAVIGAVRLANTQYGVPDAVLALGGAAVGAMAGLLAPSPNRR